MRHRKGSPVALYISTEPCNEDIDGVMEYEKLNWPTDPVRNISNFCMSLGCPELTFIHNQSPELQRLNKITHIDYTDNHAFKIICDDGSVIYWRGIVIGPETVTTTEFELNRDGYTFGLNQAPIHTGP